MALDVPFDQIVQAYQRGNQNKQQMFQTIGQTIANLGATGGDILQKRAEALKKQKAQKDLYAQLSQIPQFASIAGPMSSDPALIGQLGPELLKPKTPQKDWSPVPGGVSEGDLPIFYNRTNPTEEVLGSIPMKQTGYAASIGPIRQNQMLESLVKMGRDTVDPYFQHGPGKEMATRLDSIARIKPLIQQIQSQPDGPDPRQMRELATSFTKVLAGGGAGAEAQISALVPQTARGSAAKLIEWLSNDPKGTQQQAFVKRYSDSINREEKAITDRINMQIQASVPELRLLKRVDPDLYNGVLESARKKFSLDQTAPPSPSAQTNSDSDPLGILK